jgi:hypothetical protein
MTSNERGVPVVSEARMLETVRPVVTAAGRRVRVTAPLITVVTVALPLPGRRQAEGVRR